MPKVVTTVTAQAAPDDPASQTPTVTHYELVAAKLSSAIDEALALIRTSPSLTRSPRGSSCRKRASLTPSSSRPSPRSRQTRSCKA